MTLYHFTSSALFLAAFSAPALAAPRGSADICHWDAGVASVITISENAVAKHVANHGDSPASLYFADIDGDGYGDPDGATDRCPNDGFVDDATDCDDNDASVNPGAVEIPYDGIDNDCSASSFDDDLDQDGFGAATDCDDSDAAVHPDAEEICGDGVDNNCSGQIDEECGSCPCFGEADIRAAYQAFDAFEPMFSILYGSSIGCFDQGVSLDRDVLSLGFYQSSASGLLGSEEAYEDRRTIFSTEVERALSGTELTCGALDTFFIWEGGAFTSEGGDAWGLPVTDAEYDTCREVILAVAAENETVCERHDYAEYIEIPPEAPAEGEEE